MEAYEGTEEERASRNGSVTSDDRVLIDIATVVVELSDGVEPSDGVELIVITSVAVGTCLIPETLLALSSSDVAVRSITIESVRLALPEGVKAGM